MGRFRTLLWFGVGSSCSVLAMVGCVSGATEQSNERPGAGATLNEPAVAVPPKDDRLQQGYRQDYRLPKDYRLHLEQAVGIRFPMPKQGVELRVSSFDATLPAYKFRHEVSFVVNGVVRVLIHVWDNPEHLGSRAWFDQNMAELEGPQTAVRQQLVSKRRLPAVMLDEPAGEALSLARAVFTTKNHAYEVVCVDPTNHPDVKALFDQVVDGFEPEVTR